MGEGFKDITKRLNAARAPAPRSQQGRIRAWTPSTVRRTRYAKTASGAVEGLDPCARRRSYLLSGFARRSVCGGAIQAVSRSSTTGRLFRYVCGQYVNVCGNRRMARMETADAAIRELLANEVLRPGVLERAPDLALEMLSADRQEDERERRRQELEQRLAKLETQLANLADTAARGGAVPVILEALTRTDAERRAVLAQLQVETRSRSEQVSAPAITLRRELRSYVCE
jgi:hypothetical protein